MDGEMATEMNKTSEDYSVHKKAYSNSRRKSKPKNQRGNYDSNSPRTNAYNIVVITTGPNGSSASVEADEECLDDNASVCSSQSSGASEHSFGANKKVKKIRRVRCEIHSKKNKNDSSLLEEPEDSKANDNPKDERQSSLACTCSKSKTRIRRPDPEGGLISGGKGISSSTVMSELDQILYSNEPLFSDLEGDKELEQNGEGDDGLIQTKQKLSRNVIKKGTSVDEQVKPESDRIHGRLEHSGAGTNLESAFCLQMLNTNTSIKFAILQTELKNIKDRSLKRVEADVTSITTKFSSMQELMENCIETLSSFTQQVQQTSKFINAQIERERREERELISSHIDLDIMNVSSKENFCFSDLDVANCRLSYLERIMVGLESEIKSLGTTNTNERTRLKERLKEVHNDMSSTERIIMHISSCLHVR